ncbi:endonuclease I, partial [Aquimarina celericrescens]|nr:endonuclease I [Aquimarina celericrescens]
GTSPGSVSIDIVDDAIDEGDEFINIVVDIIEDPFILNSNFIQIIVVDNDFTVADWGIPTNPTFDKVNSTGPTNYFESLNGKSGN